MNHGEHMSNAEDKKSIENALQSSLRLHPKRIELGKAEMLTDALLQPFDDLERRLNTYISGSADTVVLRKEMHAYLSRLNANRMIPLHFRLKVLKRFEEQLDLFNAEMTASVLNAHKICIDMVQKEALKESSYYQILVNMISDSIELAGRLMRHALSDYEAPAVITVRQVFDLMRLGMLILPELPESAQSERQRLYLAIARYELLRNLDFFSLTKTQQGMVMEEIGHHIGALRPFYLAKNGIKGNEIKGYSLMATCLSRPHDTAQVLPFPPNNTASDFILVPMDDFIDKLVLSIDRAEKVLKNLLLQSKDMQIEDALHATVVGGNAILDALRNRSRVSERVEYGNAKVVVGWSLRQAIQEIQSQLATEETAMKQAVDMENHTARHGAESWTVKNISKHGMAVERMSADPLKLGVGALLGLHWQVYQGEPRLGFIRWIRYPKSGEQQMGIAFYLRPYVPVEAVMLAVGDTTQHKSWMVLLTFEEDGEHTVLFPDTAVFKGMVISFDDQRYPGYFKVIKVADSGLNYSICTVRLAKELDSSSVHEV